MSIGEPNPGFLCSRLLRGSWRVFRYRRGNWSGAIQGTMAFDRKRGMNNGISSLRSPNRVEVSVNPKANRVSVPPVALTQ